MTLPFISVSEEELLPLSSEMKSLGSENEENTCHLHPQILGKKANEILGRLTFSTRSV
jgi:hypothetical protein